MRGNIHCLALSTKVTVTTSGKNNDLCMKITMVGCPWNGEEIWKTDTSFKCLSKLFKMCRRQDLYGIGVFKMEELVGKIVRVTGAEQITES